MAAVTICSDFGAQENKVCLICLEYLKLFHKHKLFSLAERKHSSYTLDGNFTSFIFPFNFLPSPPENFCKTSL